MQGSVFHRVEVVISHQTKSNWRHLEMCDLQVYIHIHTCTPAYMYTYIHVHMYTHVHMHACMYTCTRASHVYTCIHAHVYTHVHVHTHMYVSRRYFLKMNWKICSKPKVMAASRDRKQRNWRHGNGVGEHGGEEAIKRMLAFSGNYNNVCNFLGYTGKTKM